MTEAAARAEQSLDTDRPGTKVPAPLRAVHTPNFPALLRDLGASLLVTTYQAGKLVMVRDLTRRNVKGNRATTGSPDIYRRV